MFFNLNKNDLYYSITNGPDDIFAITPESGIVYTKTTIDRESDQSFANGAFIIGIRAYEEGGNSAERPFVDTEVTIMIEVIISKFIELVITRIHKFTGN